MDDSVQCILMKEENSASRNAVSPNNKIKSTSRLGRIGSQSSYLDRVVGFCVDLPKLSHLEGQVFTDTFFGEKLKPRFSSEYKKLGVGGAQQDIEKLQH